MSGGKIAVVMGVLVIITGIALVGVQAYESWGDGAQEESYQLLMAQTGKTSFEVETGFPGVPIIALGVILLIAGALIAR